MTFPISPDAIRIAIMAERYGSGDMQVLARAFRELYAFHQSMPCWPVEPEEEVGAFDANDEQSPMGVI